MVDALKGMIGSKKAIAFIVGLVLSGLALFGLDAPKDVKLAAAESVAVLVGAYIVGQGVADHGKEKAKIENSQKSKGY